MCSLIESQEEHSCEENFQVQKANTCVRLLAVAEGGGGEEEKRKRGGRDDKDQEVSGDSGDEEDGGDSRSDGGQVMMAMMLVVALEMVRTTELIVTMLVAGQEEETAEQILFMLFGPRIWEHNGQCCHQHHHLCQRCNHHPDKMKSKNTLKNSTRMKSKVKTL